MKRRKMANLRSTKSPANPNLQKVAPLVIGNSQDFDTATDLYDMSVAVLSGSPSNVVDAERATSQASLEQTS